MVSRPVSGRLAEPLGEPIVQVAYFVSDVRAAAQRMSETLGAGPFYVADRIELAWGEHRGMPCQFVHSSAYGQWGDLMLELVQQDEPGPSPFRDCFAPGEEGLHHMAMMVDSLPATYAQCAALGYPLAARAQTKGGTEFAFIDTRQPFGHLLEVYERSELLTGFYRFVREAAAGWDGAEPVRELGRDRPGDR